MRIIGLDVGEKRIGVARADSDTRIAVPIGFIEVDGSEWQEIARLARLNNTDCFVLGLPRSNEGNETVQSAYVRNFAKTLKEKMPEAKIRFQDESLTSVVAEERLKSRKKPYQKGDIDAEAASIILQDFVEGVNNSAGFTKSTANLSVDEVANGINQPGATINEDEQVKVNTKKHKMKTATKIITGVVIVVILGLIATGVALFIRDQRYKEYAEFFAAREAEMNEDNTFEFTIFPGENIYEIKAKLIDLGYPATEVEEAFDADYNFAFLQGRPEGATLEGYLYGETHQFYKDSTVKEILTEYLAQMGKVITENNLEARFAEKGLTLYEGITLASVVQKEAPTPEMPTVAQVFLKRLEYGMALGSDVTVSYALDTVDPGRNSYSDNSSALTIDSCYNTRLYPGLPCGPISNPSLDAMLAVAEPTDSAYLYFLTGDDGLMYYSYTEDEHIQNIYSHCQNLCNVAL